MSVPKTLLLDTNVWISFFIEGDSSHDETVRLLEEATSHNVTLSYTASTLKDVFYIVPRRARAQAIAAGFDVSNATFSPIAWACAEKMTEIAVAVGQSLPECSLAWMLRGEHPDLEDNLIMAAAETSNVDFVVTYDKDMLEHFSPACITPAQALRLLELHHHVEV